MNVLKDIWHGFWQGIGVELSFFWIWVSWKVTHNRFIQKMEPGHWLHALADYFK